MSERDAFIKHTSKEEMADELTARFEQIQRLNEIIRIEQERSATLQAAKQQAEQANVCDACAGNGKPVSGERCMCGGSGKMSDAAIYLRSELLKAEQKTRALEAALANVRKAVEEDAHDGECGIWSDLQCDCWKAYITQHLLSTQTEETRGE